jgi:hypothetical protein
MAVDPMSDIKKSNVRKPSRSTTKSLAAGKITSLPDFAARRKVIFPRQISAAQARLVDKLIGGQ